MTATDDRRPVGAMREALTSAMVSSIAAAILMFGVLLARPPSWRAEAELRFDRQEPGAIAELLSLGRDADIIAQLAAEQRFADDPAFARTPLENLTGRLVERTTIRAIPGNRAVALTVTARDPGRAAEAADSYAAIVLEAAQRQHQSRASDAPAAAPEAPPAPAPEPATAPPEAPERALDATVEAARKAVEAARADLARFEQGARTDPSVATALANAEAVLAASERDEQAARQRLVDLEALAKRLPAEALADQAFSGPRLADLRRRHSEATALEKALAAELGDRHPLLVDARNERIALDAEVRAALSDIVTQARADLVRAEQDVVRAREALGPLQTRLSETETARDAEAELRRAVELAEQTLTTARALAERSMTEPLRKPEPEQPPPAPDPAEPAPALEPLPLPRLEKATTPLRPIGPAPVVLMTSAALLGGGIGLVLVGGARLARRIRQRPRA